MADNQNNTVLVAVNKLKERFGLSRINRRLSAGLSLIIASIVLAVIFYNLFFVYVKPHEYGIKVNRAETSRGVQKEIYHAGLTSVIPFGLQEMYRLPKDIQVLELTNFPDTAVAAARKDRAAQIQTSDGFFVKENADLLVKLAEAEKVRLRNNALKGIGSDRMVALKMADAYKGLDLTILPSDGQQGVTPLNLNTTLRLFDVRKRGSK